MKTYDKYKSSGIDWIGDIPEHWEAKRLKWICALEYGNSLATDNRIDGEIPVYGSNGITGYHTDSITESPCIVVGRKGSFGKLNWSNEKCFPIDTTYFIDETKTNENLRWLFYLLQNLELDSFSKDTGVPGLSREDAYSKIAPFPTLDEQTAIAEYLDEKTAQIDKLIDEKRRLIELLKEERLGVINQAVTRGINRNAKLKPSGIAWLGDIPEHWEVKKLKFVAKVNPTQFSYDYDKSSLDEVVFLPMEKVSEGGEIDQEFRKQIAEVNSGFTYFERNDVIVAKITPCFENGKGALLNKLETDFGFGSTEFHTLRATELIDKYFLFYITKSERFMTVGEAFMSGSAGQKRVPTDFVKNFFIGLPPIEEQKQIVEFIETAAARIDATIAQIEKEIGFLREYRTALISEVVTGKIKVC